MFSATKATVPRGHREPSMDSARILLVDDDPAITRSLCGVLQIVGKFHVLTENDGRRTLDVARIFKPDLILLDVLEPKWDGGEIAADLDRDSELANIPVAFITGLVGAEELDERQTDSRGRRLIPKTLPAHDLVEVVRGLLAGRVLKAKLATGERGKDALARILAAMTAVSAGALSDAEVAALADRLWPDVKTVVRSSMADHRGSQEA